MKNDEPTMLKEFPMDIDFVCVSVSVYGFVSIVALSNRLCAYSFIIVIFFVVVAIKQHCSEWYSDYLFEASAPAIAPLYSSCAPAFPMAQHLSAGGGKTASAFLL